MEQNKVRPIDANSFIRKLLKHCTDTPFRSTLIETINQEPTIILGSPWTRITEDLPKVSGNYICMHGGNRKLCWFWAETQTFEINGKKTSKITHWMELPPAPKD